MNEYVQTGAAVVAIMGIFLLGYEVRQGNRTALSSQLSNNWSLWVETRPALIESGVGAIIAKAMHNPDALTLAEKINLGWYLESWINLYHQNIIASVELGLDADWVESLLADEIAAEAPNIFGSRWSRAWLDENKEWMMPEVIAALEKGLRDAPIGSDLDYYERIDARAAAVH
jgi:hypothetical protein